MVAPRMSETVLLVLLAAATRVPVPAVIQGRRAPAHPDIARQKKKTGQEQKDRVTADHDARSNTAFAAANTSRTGISIMQAGCPCGHSAGASKL